MVENILDAFMENLDKLNATVLIPPAFDFLKSGDAQFETSTSARIQTLMLFYRHDLVTHSIGLLFYNEKSIHQASDDLHKKFGLVVPCRDMLKKVLKLN